MTRPIPLALTLAALAAPPALAAPADLAVVHPVTDCAALAQTDITAIGGSGSTITKAEETTSDGIAVCSVTGQLAPEIGFQVVLPRETWTQRYLQIGCGGLCGNISITSGASAGCQVLNDGGFVMAATDMGHSGQSEDWGLDAQKRADFAYRAQHLTAAAARALIAAYYGQPEQFSYFNGCSDGGREALMEAMRYPQDFDGVIAGAPAMMFQVQNTLYHGWQARSNMDAQGQVILLSDRLPLLHHAVLDACDGLDGQVDGLIAQPALCDFDPASLICTEGADATTCLTPAEAEVAHRFYTGPHDAQTGAALTAGGPLYGSELNWQGVYVADKASDGLMSVTAALPVLRYLAFVQPDPDFQLDDLMFTEATLDALRPRHPLFDATNPDLTDFAGAGGKLILWHGLADPHISPANTLSFYQAMQAQMGQAEVADFARLYLLPGVSHCSGGQGPSNLDLLTAMLAWVEGGAAPDAILTASTAATSSFGQPDFGGGSGFHRPAMADLGGAPLPAMTRPVWPWPATAEYSGEGDVTDAANWRRGPDAQTVPLRDWPGADFFAPYGFVDG